MHAEPILGVEGPDELVMSYVQGWAAVWKTADGDAYLFSRPLFGQDPQPITIWWMWIEGPEVPELEVLQAVAGPSPW